MKKIKAIISKIPLSIIYSIPPIVVFFIVLLAYWPGILVSDSLVQWNQVQTGIFDNWHPFYNTYYIYILTRIWNNPGFVLFIQILIVSFSIGLFFSKITKYYKVNKVYLFISSTVISLIPINYNFAITLLKDTLYSALIIYFMSLILDMICNKSFFEKKKNYIYIGFLSLITMLTRHNGILLIAVLAIVLIISFRKEKKLWLPFAFSIILYLIMTSSTFFSIIKVSEANYSNKYAPISHLMADFLNSDIEFTEEELKKLGEYTDIKQLKESYNPYNMDYSINSQKVDALKENGKEYLNFGMKKIFENLGLTIKHYAKLLSFLYSPIPFYNSFTVGMFIETDLWVYEDVYPNLAENSKIPQLLPTLKTVQSSYQSGNLGIVTMRPSIYIYMSIIFCIILLKIYKNKKLFLLCLPALCNIISLMPAMPVAMTRYVYSAFLTFYLLVAFMLYVGYKKIVEERRKNEKK
ncbi:MAG: DUF6020 family protein [bacterium]|nr:DUF6020 family protein [bacterium]